MAGAGLRQSTQEGHAWRVPVSPVLGPGPPWGGTAVVTGRQGSSPRCCAHGAHWGPPLGPWPKLPQGGASETPWGAPWVSHMPREPSRREEPSGTGKPSPFPLQPPRLTELRWCPLVGRRTLEPRLGKGGWTWSREAGTRDLTLTCNQCGLGPRCDTQLL